LLAGAQLLDCWGQEDCWGRKLVGASWAVDVHLVLLQSGENVWAVTCIDSRCPAPSFMATFMACCPLVCAADDTHVSTALPTCHQLCVHTHAMQVPDSEPGWLQGGRWADVRLPHLRARMREAVADPAAAAAKGRAARAKMIAHLSVEVVAARVAAELERINDLLRCVLCARAGW
jgi:hypothetical protein